jgi:DNA-binding MarR family transcriptional regulator
LRTISQSDLTTRLRLAIARTARRLRQEGGGELSPSLASALATIDRHGPITPSALADRERIQRPTVTRVVARLEELELVARVADPEDRRSYLVSASDEGRALLKRQRRRKDAYLAAQLRDLPPEERETLARAVTILERLLEDRGA